MTRLWITFVAPVFACCLTLAPGDASAQTQCQQVRFAPGSSTGLIEGEIPPEGRLCFALDVGAGQTAVASITGPEAQFPVMMIEGITREGGDQTATWLTQAGRYEIHVMTLFRYGANTPFRLQLTVTGG